MKNKVVVIGFCIVLIFSYFPFALAHQEKCCDEEYPKIIVQGEGRIETIADKAYFKIRVRVEEKRLERAFEESAKKINSLSEVLTSHGIKKEDIKNLGYIYHPLYEGKPIFSTISKPTSYEVIYSLKITIYNLENLGKVLAALSEIPETTVFGLEYTSTKIEELKREALKKAGDDAHQKALKAAEGAAATLGKVIKIETGSQIFRAKEYDVMAEAPRLLKEQAYTSIPAPQIEAGYLEIVGTCTVYYSIQ